MENVRRIRVVIVGDQPILRDALKVSLSLERDIEVVGEAADAKDAIELIDVSRPDIVLLDSRMPRVSGLSVLTYLQCESPATRAIVLTDEEDKAAIVLSMKRGASGVVCKTAPTETLVAAIHTVRAGHVWLDAKSQALVVREFACPDSEDLMERRLSEREHEIVELVAKGYKNREIARALCITANTVRNHIHRVFQKLDISDRVHLALYALGAGPSPAERVSAGAYNRGTST